MKFSFHNYWNFAKLQFLFMVFFDVFEFFFLLRLRRRAAREWNSAGVTPLWKFWFGLDIHSQPLAPKKPKFYAKLLPEISSLYKITYLIRNHEWSWPEMIQSENWPKMTLNFKIDPNSLQVTSLVQSYNDHLLLTRNYLISEIYRIKRWFLI